MKYKVFALVTALLLIVCLCVSVCATETTVTQSSGAGSADVYVTKTPAASAATVYSVDITWGSMEFTYKTNDTQRWDPEQLKYVVDSGEDEWICENGADKITVANRSNAEITAGFGYTALENSGVSAAFADYSSGTVLSDGKVTLEAPVVSTDAQNPTVAPSTDVRIELSGTPNIAENAKTKVGSVTVTITGNASADSGTSSGETTTTAETTTEEAVVAGVKVGETPQGIAVYTTNTKAVYTTDNFKPDATSKLIVNKNNPLLIDNEEYWVLYNHDLSNIKPNSFVTNGYYEVDLTKDGTNDEIYSFAVVDVQICLEIDVENMKMTVYKVTE